MTILTLSAIKVLGISAVASAIAVLWSPFLINFLYKHKLWKKQARTKTITGEEAVIFNALHKERETKVPRMGGLLIFITTAFVTLLFYFASQEWYMYLKVASLYLISSYSILHTKEYSLIISTIQ